MSHPLFSFSDAELGIVLKDATPTQRHRFLTRRQTQDPTERQTLLAEFHALTKPDGFRWPWTALDSQLGLLPMGELAVVLGQSGQGKTTFTSSLLNRLGQTPALVFATEIKDDRYLVGLAARKAGLHPDRVIQGLWEQAGYRQTASESRRSYEQALSEVRAAPLTIAPFLSLRASQLSRSLTQAVEGAQTPPQVVVVDHFQAIDHDLGSGYQAQQETLRVLHQFAHDHYLTLIVTNQATLRGQGQSYRPSDCIDLSGSFGGQTLIQFAAQVIGLHRVFQHITPTGTAITPAFLAEHRKAGLRDSDLYDRERVEVDLLKIRYDANGAAGNAVRLKYRDGQYWDAED